MRFQFESDEAKDARLKQWKRWFAWHPIWIEYELIWLEWVDRRFTRNNYACLGGSPLYWTHYRKVQSGKQE
jgi:hypothetical protein